MGISRGPGCQSNLTFDDSGWLNPGVKRHAPWPGLAPYRVDVAEAAVDVDFGGGGHRHGQLHVVLAHANKYYAAPRLACSYAHLQRRSQRYAHIRQSKEEKHGYEVKRSGDQSPVLLPEASTSGSGRLT